MKQTIIRTLVFAELCLLSPTISNGQQLGGTSADSKMIGAQSGHGSGLGGLFTPNLYDGSANINIPIYEYATDAGNYGISLAYNTKGVKVDELSSPVGLHFNLVAEGMIQRQVKGLPDELNILYSDTIWATPTTRYNKFRGRLASSFDNGAEATNTMVYRDQESDDYMVSVGGLSFTFNIGTGRAIYTNPKKNLIVEMQSNGQPYDQVVQQTGTLPDARSIEFLITDMSGNKYHFKKGDYDHNELFADMNANINVGSIGNYDVITRWVIDYLLLANGTKIAYSYYDEGGTASIYKSYSNGGYNNAVGAQVINKGNYYSMLRSIIYPNATTAYFVYDTLKTRCDYGNEMSSTGSMALREIRISSGSNCTRYQMDQSYTVVKNGTNTTISEIPYGANCVSVAYMPSNRMHRLRLKGINLLSCDGTVSEPFYSFSYDPTELPLRFSGSQDWFGYFNGKTPLPYGSMADPDLTIPLSPYFSYGVDRSEDISKMKAGILTAINNAFGGTISFNYGAHVLTNPLAGTPNNSYYFGANANDGLRLESIVESDIYHLASYKRTDFTYYEGQRFLSGGYFHFPTHISSVGSVNATNTILTGNYLTPHQLIGGSNHGYSKVVVTTSTESGQMLSKKEIRFTNFSDSLSGYQPRYTRAGGGKHFYEFPYTDKQYLRDWEMGLPMYIVNYDQYGRILEKIVNNYRFSIDTVSAVDKGVQGLKTSFVKDPSIPTPPPGSLFEFQIARVPVTDAYKPYNGTALLTNTTTYKYHTDNDFVADQVNYEYDVLNNIKATTTYNSAGEEVKMINYYNYDVVGFIGSVFFNPFQGQERLLSTQRWKRIAGTTGNLPDNGLLLDASFTGYGEPGNSSTASKVWIRNQYQFRSLNPITYAQYLGTGTYNTTARKVWAAFEGQAIPYFKKTNEVKDFDDNGCPLETQIMEQDQYKAMIWDGLTGQKLAEANARYTDIGFTSFEWAIAAGAIQPDFTTQGNFRFCPARIVNIPPSTNTPVSGPKIFKLDNTPVFTPNGNIDAGFIEGTQNLEAGKTYKLSFWSNGQLPLVFAGSQPITLNSTAIVSSKGNWDNYQVTFIPNSTGKVSLKANGAQITYLDEVRLHPMNASMINYTYEPLFGIRTSTDPTGRITYYFYDQMGRQFMVRDQKDNILSKKQFVIKGAQ